MFEFKNVSPVDAGEVPNAMLVRSPAPAPQALRCALKEVEIPGVGGGRERQRDNLGVLRAEAGAVHFDLTPRGDGTDGLSVTTRKSGCP